MKKKRIIKRMATAMVGFSCAKQLLPLIEQRRHSLGLSRSAYLTQLIRQDLALNREGFHIVAADKGVHVRPYEAEAVKSARLNEDPPRKK